MRLEDIRRVDPQGMYDAIRDFPEQWRQGRELARGFDPGFTVEGKDHLVVAGMGGSAIGGDLLRTLVADTARLPVTVVRHYQLPGFVTERSVVIASSYSGNTEETLAAFEEARARGATVVCVASGGELLRRARTEGLPYLQIPGGLQPRAALGYSFTALLTIAEHIGLVAPDEAAWNETQELLEQQSEVFGDPSGNDALELAEALQDRLPFIYSGTGLMEAVNLRWRCQIQENAKRLASGNVYPELNHNEIMGWEYPGPLHEMIGVIVLRDREDHPRVQQRMEVTRALISDRAGYWAEVQSQGESRLARMMSLVNLGDWVSLYLAVLLGVDPTPVPLIGQLKETLARV